MKKLLLPMLVLSLGACSLFGDKSEDKPEKPAKKLGVFHKGPYKDEASGKFCNGPGGFCEDDGKCHTIKEKCLAK